MSRRKDDLAMLDRILALGNELPFGRNVKKVRKEHEDERNHDRSLCTCRA